jgi:CHAT domain-containing protein/Tfp pilus assembly protein PilF
MGHRAHAHVISAFIYLLLFQHTMCTHAADAKRYSNAWSDDFKTDSRERYDISGPVRWEPAELSVRPGASIRGRDESGPVAELALNLEWSKPTGAIDATSFRVQFIFSKQKSVAVELNRAIESKTASGTIKFFTLSRNEGDRFTEKLVWQQQIRDELPSGLWTFRYHHGVVSLLHGERRISLHYVEPIDHPRLTWALENRNGNAICRSLVWRTTASAPRWKSKPPEQLEGEDLNKRRRWNDAIAAEQHASNLADQGKLDESLPVLGACLKTYVDLAGPEDVSSIRAAITIGGVLLQLDKIEPAKKILLGMIPVQRAVLGEDHPAYAISLISAGTLANEERQYVEAQKLYEQAYVIQVESLGNERPESLRTLLSICYMSLNRKDYVRAVSAGEQAVALTPRVFGPDSSEYVTALGRLASAYTHSKDYAKSIPLFERAIAVLRKIEGERSVDASNFHGELAQIYVAQGNLDKAEKAFRDVLAIREEKLGLEDPLTADARNRLGTFLFQQRRDFAAAALIYQRELAIQRKLGVNRTEYCYVLTNMANVYLSTDKNDQAEALILEAAGLLASFNAPVSEDLANCRSQLSWLFEKIGRSDAAIQQARLALDINKKVFGEENSRTADSMHNLGRLYYEAHVPQQARPLFGRALEIRRKVLGEKHLDTAETLDLLGRVTLREDQRAAYEMISSALKIRSELLGPDDLSLADTFDQLGFVWKEAGDLAHTYGQAEEYFQKALEIRQRHLGNDHPNLATSYNNLGFLYNAWARYDMAVENNRRALEIRRRTFRKTDGRIVQSLGNLAYGYEGLGRFELAEPLVREMLDLGHADLILAARGTSLRLQQEAIVAHRHEIDSYISHMSQAQRVGHVDDKSPEMLATLLRRAHELNVQHMDAIRFPDLESDRCFGYVIQWKGMPFSRQEGLRKAALKRQVPSKLADLQRTTGRMAALAFSPVGQAELPSWSRQFQELSDENARLEAELLAEFDVARTALTPTHLRELLPDGVALVDLLEYTYTAPPLLYPKGVSEWDRRLVAFVVRRDRPIVQVDLGTTLHMSDAIDSWYRDNVPNLSHQRIWNTVKEPGRLLRAKLWEPLEKHLSGVGIILVCPDGPSARVPWGALPGKEQGTYLIEERAFAFVSSPQVLAERLERKTSTPAMTTSNSLLLMGDVAFGPLPIRPAQGQEPAEPRAAQPANDRLPYAFTRLPNTRKEIDTLAQLFRESFPGSACRAYKGPDASEATIRAQITQHRYLHIATHGYLASVPDDSEVGRIMRGAGFPRNPWQETTGSSPFFGEKQALIESHPGLLSGLALAGINQSQRVVPDLDSTENDGIFTAADLAGLDLSHVELAVLSACDTGSGATSPGDGVHGLERAFQAAGVRTTVTSLWKVNDDATRELMVNFYRRLWGKENRFSKLEALRQAQVAMLKGYDPKLGRIRGVAGVRAQDPITSPKDRAPLHFWAAFTLSGDWR